MSDTDDSEVEHISILEYTEAAADHDRTPGERVILGGYRRNTHVRDDEKKGFVEIAKAVAVIELHQPIPEDDVTDWCNSQAGKLALSPWVGNYEPEEVIDTGTAAKKRAMTDGGVDQSEAEADHDEMSGEQIPTLDDVLDMNLEHDEENDRKWVVLYDEDYDDLCIDVGDSVALLLDNNQACELLKLTSQVIADLAPEYAPEKEPIQAMIDALQGVQDDAE